MAALDRPQRRVIGTTSARSFERCPARAETRRRRVFHDQFACERPVGQPPVCISVAAPQSE